MARETYGQDRTFYLVMAIVCSLVLFAGFAPSYYLKGVIHAPPPLSALTVTHGVVFTGWMLLFVAQTALISLDRPALHRQLGMLGAVLFGVMLCLGMATAITAGRLGHAPPGSPTPLAFMALPIISLSTTTLILAAALLLRRQSDWHKRLMLATYVALTPPALGRLAIGAGHADQSTPLAFLGMLLLLGAAMVYDFRTHKRVHSAYVWAAGVFLVTQATVFWAFASPPQWMEFARWITSGG